MADAKSKILIVEDDLDVAEMLNAYFRVQGYEVFTVNWGEDGVRAAQTVLPDLMILDIRLPDHFRPSLAIALDRRPELIRPRQRDLHRVVIAPADGFLVGDAVELGAKRASRLNRVPVPAREQAAFAKRTAGVGTGCHQAWVTDAEAALGIAR